MSRTKKSQKGAFGGKAGKIRKAQKRWIANRGLKEEVMNNYDNRDLIHPLKSAPSLPGSRIKIKEEDCDTQK